jgi:Ca2+/H+ antiporter
MAVTTSQHGVRRWVIVLTAFAVLAVALILFARVALDIALALAMCAGVFLVQRTAGDWLSDVLGARFGTLIFASVIAIFLWLLLVTSGGQSLAEQFLSVADEHGFHTVFLQRQIIPPSSVRRLPSSTPGESAARSRHIRGPESSLRGDRRRGRSYRHIGIACCPRCGDREDCPDASDSATDDQPGEDRSAGGRHSRRARRR